MSTYNPRPLQPVRTLFRLVVAATLLSLVFAAGASAATRYAEPGGSGDDCTQSHPCDIQRAVEQDSVGDEVILNAGTYLLGEDGLLAQRGSFVHPASGAAVRIEATGSAPGVRVSGSGTVLADVTVSKDGRGPGLAVDSDATAERVYSEAVGEGAACAPTAGATLKDSVCLQRTLGPAVSSRMSGLVNQTVTLANVSVVNLGAGGQAGGILLDSSNGAKVTLNATNVLISTGDVFAVDALAQSDKSGSSAAIVLVNSNFRTRDSTGRNATVTPVGSETNEVAQPLFVDRGAGNFHQLAGSPTVDAGSAAAVVSGDEDLDREERTIGSAPDIGADELDPLMPPDPTEPPAPTPDAGDPVAQSEPSADHLRPSVTVTEAPKSKVVARTKTINARFEFEASEEGSLLECRMDGGTFTPCSSPVRFVIAARKGRGERHTFFVHATDPSGNVGGSALRSLRVLKKPRKGH